MCDLNGQRSIVVTTEFSSPIKWQPAATYGSGTISKTTAHDNAERGKYGVCVVVLSPKIEITNIDTPSITEIETSMRDFESVQSNGVETKRIFRFIIKSGQYFRNRDDDLGLADL
ncbi:hypothetical protein ABFS83_09G046400 [Erythranthe nasuta]